MARIFQKINRLINGPEISIFHEFHKPPYGGGNQFLLALEREFKNRGLDVGRNKAGRNSKVVLFNSFNFNFEKLSKIHEKFHPLMVHRVDGPISVYRGKDDGIDRRIAEMNAKLADHTIFQSHYSRDKHRELGLPFKNPHIIMNAADPQIFHTAGRILPPDGKRKIKLIATSWSDNLRKGGPLLSWLDENLDQDRFELTFVGRIKAEFKNTRVLDALPSQELADILRQNDIYIAASENDPCSNALIEALACGLPAIYRRSGGHPEIVGRGGEGFSAVEEARRAIELVSADWQKYHDAIKIPSLKEIADKYLEIFKI